MLVRREAEHRKAFSLTPAYLAHGEGGRGLTGGDLPWFSDYGFQLSRGFRALKAWMSLKEHGVHKYGRLIQQNIDQARYLAELIEAAPELELVAPVTLNVVCFRYVAPGLDDAALDATEQADRGRVAGTGHRRAIGDDDLEASVCCTWDTPITAAAGRILTSWCARWCGWGESWCDQCAVSTPNRLCTKEGFTMPLSKRNCQDEADYWRIRVFLREIHLLNDRRDLSWPVMRFDYWRWHGIKNCGHGRLEQDVFIWETNDGQMAAVLNREGPGEAFLQVHPALRTPDLEGEMLSVAEQRLAIDDGSGGRRLRVYADEGDGLRQDVLRGQGYAESDWPEVHWRRHLSGGEAQPIPDAPAPAGYVVRALGDESELPARSWLSWRAFHPDEPADGYDGWEWYLNLQRMPLYRRDLDIVAVAPDGELAAFCTLWYDDVTRTGYFEPVGTAPEHQRRGLARAVMCEGLRRLQRMGGTLATVLGYNKPADAPYAAVMGGTPYLLEAWAKEIDSPSPRPSSGQVRSE